MYVFVFVYLYYFSYVFLCFYVFLINCMYVVITTCFVESSLQVVENQRSVVFSVMLSNPSSANILLKIFSNKESTTGELKMHSYLQYD